MVFPQFDGHFFEAQTYLSALCLNNRISSFLEVRFQPKAAPLDFSTNTSSMTRGGAPAHDHGLEIRNSATSKCLLVHALTHPAEKNAQPIGMNFSDRLDSFS